jgi:hypothetical protein
LTYACAALLTLAALALAYARRRHRAEAATILIVALPVVLSVSANAPHWYESLRTNYRLSQSTALAIAPPVITTARNLPLAERALSAIAPDETYAVVPHYQSPPRTAAARRERARMTYLASWLQYWLAPRLQVDRTEADWLILLDATGEAPPPGALDVYEVGGDILVRRR